MPQLNVTISTRPLAGLLGCVERTQEPIAHIVSKALAEYFQVPHHTLYQVSTATALVEGIYQGARASQEHCESTAISARARLRISTAKW